MVNQPDQDVRGVQTPESKLVLPAPPDGGPYRQRYSSPLPDPRMSRRVSTTSHRLWQLIRKDPAYAVLALGIALVIFASFVFLVLGANLLLSSNNGVAWNSAQTQHPSVPAPSGTVDNNPSFPTPATGKGTSKSSQPAAGPTPVLQPSPNPPGDQGTLSVQITSVPSVVSNNTRVLVGVQTSESGVSLRLQVTYNASPFFYSSSGNTGGDGNGTLVWNVRVRSLLSTSVQATLVVFATDQNGQQATSQPVTVMITSGGMGG
jgi:hypothetical protein